MVNDPRDDRRRLLRLAMACAAGQCLPRSAWSQPRWPSQPFALGVASGSPTESSVVLWTRLAAQDFVADLGRNPVTVRWELAHDDQFQRIVRRGQAQAMAELAHSVHVEIDGLAADRWYFYRFMAGDAVSPVGPPRPFPEPGAPAASLRLAYPPCQRWGHRYFRAHRPMREEDLGAVMVLRDYTY